MPNPVLNRRVQIVAQSLAAGAVAGAAVWWMFATGSEDQSRLQADQVALRQLKIPGRPASILGGLVAEATVHPLFTLTTGPGAQPEPVIRVSGLSRTPVHRAALLSVNGGAPVWLNIGQAMSGVTLLDVQSSKVVVETPFGRRDVDLDAEVPSPTPSPAAAAHADVAPPAVGSPRGP